MLVRMIARLCVDKHEDAELEYYIKMYVPVLFLHTCINHNCIHFQT